MEKISHKQEVPVTQIQPYSFSHIIYNQLQCFIVSIKNIACKTHNMVYKH